MNRRAFLECAVMASGVTATVVVNPNSARAQDTGGYLMWSAQQAETIATSTHRTGKVGSRFNERLLKTERAVNYKMIATWMTPEVVRGTARTLQLRNRLTDEQTRALVAEADKVDRTVFMIELDPREGSGVIPREWETYLELKGVAPSAATTVRGVLNNRLRDVEALCGVVRRNYDYDRFWVEYPLVTAAGTRLFAGGASQVDLVVRVFSQEERTTYGIPEGFRGR